MTGYALLTDTSGRAITTSGGAPTLGYSMPADEGLRGDVRFVSGRAPTRANEVAAVGPARTVARVHVLRVVVTD